MDGESLQAQLSNYEAEFRAIDAAYLGAEWDGNNLRGKWDYMLLDSDWDEIAERACESADCVWQAEDWFGGSIRDVCLTTGESLREIAEREAGWADGAILDADDAYEFLREKIAEALQELQEKDADELDADELALITLYTRLLG